MTSDRFLDYRRTVRLLAEVDVLVIGGGSAGACAAIASARSGARTMLVERYGFIGGTGVAVLDTFYGFFTPGKTESKVIGGIPDEVIEGLQRHRAVLKRPNTYGAGAGWTTTPSD